MPPQTPSVMPGLAPRALAAERDKLADAILVDGDERVRRQQALSTYAWKRTGRRGNAERRLGQIVGAKGE
jgi:hypothetical protein